ATANGRATGDAGGCHRMCNMDYRLNGVVCDPNNTAACCGPTCAQCLATRANSTPACMGIASGCVTPSICSPGFHECAGNCVSNSAVATCGASCSPCPSRPNTAAPTCDG